MLPSRADYFNLGAREILTRSASRPVGARITREAIFTDGSDINILLASSAAMADEATRALAARIGALFLDSARSDDLDRLVGDRFSPSVARKQATQSLVQTSFSRSAGTLPAGVLGAGTTLRTGDGVEFALLGAAAFLAGSTGPVVVQAQAVIAGQNGNVGVGTINEIVATPFDSNLRVTNLQVAAGGAEVESDASLRERARDFFRTARRGTLEAIEFGALTVAGVARASAIELFDSSGDPSGHVQCFVVDQSGQANSSLAAAVSLALVEYRAAGIVVDVLPALPVYEDIVYRLRFAPGVNSVAAQEQVRFLTVAEVNTLRPGEVLPTSLLTEIARTVPGVIVLDDAIASPSGDVIPAPGEVIRTTAGQVSFV